MAGRALVLGGGGVTGVAWELGVLAGLAAHGVDLADADLVVGTSAGAIVGAQILSGLPLADLYHAQLSGYGAESMVRVAGRMTATGGWAAVRPHEPRCGRARPGRGTLTAATISDTQRRAVIESRLPVHDWPAGPLMITAVDADTGDLACFDRDAGISLVDAVAASCAVPGVWPPVTIGGRSWIGGGLRSAANADLASDCHRVVVLAPVSRGVGPVAKLCDQVSGLREHGATVALVGPDGAARQALGGNGLDPGRRALAAHAGYTQAGSVAAEVRATWA